MRKRFVIVAMLLAVFILGVCNCTRQESVHFDEVPALDAVQLKETLSSDKYTMIEFGGRHCIPCRKMQPVLSELAKEHGNSIVIANVFVQEQMELGRQYKVRLIPTQVIFDKEGKEIFRHTGFWEKSEVLAKWKELKII